MYRIIEFTFLCTLASAFPFPLPGDPTVAPVAPIVAPVPTPLPFGPTPRPIGPGYNNPYYNYLGGPAVPILSYSSQHGLNGNYAFSFSTADGKQAEESGYLKDAFIDNDGNPQGTQVVQGSYSYVAPDGTPIQVNYVADENGFRPSGVHIPANGKAIVPPLNKDNKQIYDPAYNRYNPYLNRNRLFDQYNNGRPYDPRFPYEPTRANPYYNNNYNRYPIAPHGITKEEAKRNPLKI